MRDLTRLPELDGRALWSRLVDSRLFEQANDRIFLPLGDFIAAPCWVVDAGRPRVVKVRWLDTAALSEREVRELLQRARQALDDP